MKAFAITPRKPHSGRVVEVPEPTRNPNEALVETVSVGVCGTDAELAAGNSGEAPPGDDFLIIGHESLGRIVEAPPGSLRPGELVVAMVRRPDPEPCVNCAAGESDMCLNGRYTERGIKGEHGYLSERFVEDPQYLLALPDSLETVGVLVEPLSIVEKALEQIYRVQSRLVWSPKRAMVVGAGSIGTLATLLLWLNDLDVIVYSRGQGGRGRAITQAAGAQFISADSRKLDHDLEKDVGPLDIVIEATGYSPLAFAAMDVVGPNGVVCLTGISPGSRDLTIDASHLNLEIVLTNKLLFGTVNANRRHFENGILHMQAIEERWPGLLYTMITRRVPLERFTVDDIDKPGDLKVEKGHEVVGYNRSEQKTKELERDGLIGAYSFEELAAKLDPPRIVLIYVTHGDATEDVCQALRPILQSSDIVADCGNSNWRDSRRRHVFFQEADIHFLDIGTSGGLAGARSGACFMAGGESRAYEVVAHF